MYEYLIFVPFVIFAFSLGCIWYLARHPRREKLPEFFLPLMMLLSFGGLLNNLFNTPEPVAVKIKIKDGQVVEVIEHQKSSE